MYAFKQGLLDIMTKLTRSHYHQERFQSIEALIALVDLKIK